MSRTINTAWAIAVTYCCASTFWQNQGYSCKHPAEGQAPQTTALAEARVILQNISWATFERLLVEAGDHRSTRFHYLDRMLAGMPPLSYNQGSNRLIESLISA